MPRRYGVRPIAERGEMNLARRIERERTRRGWSYEALARAMTDAGCTISKAAVYSIEKGDPPRRITVDELTALADVFELAPADLLIPVELVEKQRAQELIDTALRTHQSIGDLASEVFDMFADLYDLASEDEELFEYVVNHVASGQSGRYTLNLDADHEQADVARLALLRLVKAHNDFRRSIMKSAGMWSAYRSGRWTDEDEANASTLLAELEADLEDSVETTEEQ